MPARVEKEDFVKRSVALVSLVLMAFFVTSLASAEEYRVGPARVNVTYSASLLVPSDASGAQLSGAECVGTNCVTYNETDGFITSCGLQDHDCWFNDLDTHHNGSTAKSGNVSNLGYSNSSSAGVTFTWDGT